LIEALPKPIKNENGKDEVVEYSLTLSPRMSNELKRLSKENQVTLNTVILSGLSLLLSRYMQKEEVIVGVVHSGRNTSLPEQENMLGLFINTLPLKANVNHQTKVK